MSLTSDSKSPKVKVFLVLIFSSIGFIVFGFIVFYNYLYCPCGTDTKIVNRSLWGASPINILTSDEKGYYDSLSNRSGLLQYELPLTGKFTSIVIHHSALPPSCDIKYIQNLHMKQQLFADIGYHYVINQKGITFEGRNINFRGAHVQGNNTGTIGVVLLGNFETSYPTFCQINSLTNLLNLLRQKFKVRYITTHRCFNPFGTVCPGKNISLLMPYIASSSSLIYLSK